MQINLNGIKYNFRNHINIKYIIIVSWISGNYRVTMRTSLTRLIISTTTIATYILLYYV